MVSSLRSQVVIRAPYFATLRRRHAILEAYAGEWSGAWLLQSRRILRIHHHAKGLFLRICVREVFAELQQVLGLLVEFWGVAIVLQEVLEASGSAARGHGACTLVILGLLRRQPVLRYLIELRCELGLLGRQLGVLHDKFEFEVGLAFSLAVFAHF